MILVKQYGEEKEEEMCDMALQGYICNQTEMC